VLKTIYFDANATTSLDAEILGAMMPFLRGNFGNPSSIHRLGRETRALLDDARDRGAGVLGCKPSELVFTSGGTEASNLAVLGAARAKRDQGNHLLASPTEHPSVLHCLQHLAEREGFEVSFLPVDRFGRVDPDDVSRALRPDTILASVMSANNETGTLQAVSEIGRRCREQGVVFHTDAVQSFGKEPLAAGVAGFEADLVSLCAHKFHGPKGAGALYIRSPLQPQPLVRGGPQENERRAGTENLAGIIGLVAALEGFLDPPVFPSNSLKSLTSKLADSLCDIEGVSLVSPIEGRLANTISISVEGCDSMALLAALDLAGVCASSGSACSAGSVEPSHVLLAQGYARAAASSFVRFSLDRESSEADVGNVCELFPGLVRQIREASPNPSRSA